MHGSVAMKHVRCWRWTAKITLQYLITYSYSNWAGGYLWPDIFADGIEASRSLLSLSWRSKNCVDLLPGEVLLVALWAFFWRPALQVMLSALSTGQWPCLLCDICVLYMCVPEKVKLQAKWEDGVIVTLSFVPFPLFFPVENKLV